MLLKLQDNELNKLRQLSQDKVLIEALKKFFLNNAIKHSPTDVHLQAACYLGIGFLEDSFIALANLQPAEKDTNNGKNLV